jgi:hypothetical protein
MSQSFWQSYRPVTIDLTKSFVKSIAAVSKQSPIYTQVELPTFSIGIIPWMGASFITMEFPVIGLGVPVSFITPINPPANLTFCLAVRFGTATVTRYKLWQAVGEILSYPLYNQQVLPAAGFTLEIWSVVGSDHTELLTPYTLRTSILTNLAEDSCACSCYTAPTVITLPPKTGIFASGFPMPNPGDLNQPLQPFLTIFEPN